MKITVVTRAFDYHEIKQQKNKEILSKINLISFDSMNYAKESVIEFLNKIEGVKSVIFFFRSSEYSSNVEQFIRRINKETNIKACLYLFDYEQCYSQFTTNENTFEYHYEGEIEKALKYEREQRINSYSGTELIKDFNAYLIENRERTNIKTGFIDLDIALGGGLFPKLYIIGAESSVGKTTLVLQMADNIARSGRDVIIFSLEMQTEELIARSMSRESYIANRNNEINAFTEISILNSYNYRNYSGQQLNALKLAQNEYMKYANHIYIKQGRHTMDEIYSFTESFIEVKQKQPVVIIDYLQLIAPNDTRTDTRYNINYSIDKLKEIRANFKIPVLVISSFNRSSYGSEKDNSAFKESGEIEYTADCTMVLDLVYDRTEKNASQNRINYMKAMKGEQGKRKVFLKFLKNRGNPVGNEILFDYYPKFNYFEITESDVTQ